MRCTVLLFLMVCAACVSHSEAAFFRSVVRWVKDKCSYVNRTLACSVSLGKRDNLVTDDLTDACEDVANGLQGQTGFTSQMLQQVFDNVDGLNDPAEKDGQLDAVEYAELVASLEALGECFNSED